MSLERSAAGGESCVGGLFFLKRNVVELSELILIAFEEIEC